MEKELDLNYYAENKKAVVYSNENLKQRKDNEQFEPAEIPQDVLEGKREWNLTADFSDPRTKDGIIVMREKE